MLLLLLHCLGFRHRFADFVGKISRTLERIFLVGVGVAEDQVKSLKLPCRYRIQNSRPSTPKGDQYHLRFKNSISSVEARSEVREATNTASFVTVASVGISRTLLFLANKERFFEP